MSEIFFKKPKVIVFSGHAFSGSTIFSLFLGNNPKIVNLGEVKNLENDYNENLNCTCGSKLSDCTFWQKIKIKLDESNFKGPSFDLNNNSKSSLIDKKGFLFKKLLVLIGFSPRVVYGAKNTDYYLQKNVNFFKEIQNHISYSNYIVDASKTPERLNILLDSSEIDIYCIYLKRNLRTVFNSNYKRKKKSREKFGFKFYRELILLHLREKHRKRIYNKINNKKKITFDFDNFLINPDFEYSKAINFLFESDMNHTVFNRSIEINKQHIFVGNRWIFDNKVSVILSKKEYSGNKKFGYLKSKLIELLLKN